MFSTFLTAAAGAADEADWWSTHDTLVIGVVGIFVSGFVGPTVIAWWTSTRDHEKDSRAAIARQRDDLRALVDEIAVVLGKAITQLRPLIEAQTAGNQLPDGPKDFLGGLGPLGDRLRLRLPDGHVVLTTYAAAQRQLEAVSEAHTSQSEWDKALALFESKRAAFLDAGRKAVQAPIDRKGGT